MEANTVNRSNASTDEFDIFIKQYESDNGFKNDYKDNLMEKNVIRSLLDKSNIANCICRHDEKHVETSSTHNVIINKSSANLIHLSSTVNDPNESSNHDDNYENPSTTPQLSLESDCRDNNDYTSISYTNGNTSNINSLNKCPIDYRIHCRNKYIIYVDLNSTTNKSIGTEQNQALHK